MCEGEGEAGKKAPCRWNLAEPFARKGEESDTVSFLPLPHSSCAFAGVELQHQVTSKGPLLASCLLHCAPSPFMSFAVLLRLLFYVENSALETKILPREVSGDHKPA